MYDTLSVSPLLTVFEPPVKAPAEYSVPAVLSIVVTAPVESTRKHPPTVPEDVIAKDSAEDSALDPPDAADHAAVLRVPV